MIDKLRALLMEADLTAQSPEAKDSCCTLEDLIFLLEETDEEDLEEATEDVLEELKDLAKLWSASGEMSGLVPRIRALLIREP